MTVDKANNPKARHLLVVDDDSLVLSVISTGLVDAGYAVTSAETAEDAEAWLAGGIRPDLAILDVHMPGQGGAFSGRTSARTGPHSVHHIQRLQRRLHGGAGQPLRGLGLPGQAAGHGATGASG